jgi:hypothetical protein
VNVRTAAGLRKTVLVHRLVATAFLGPRPACMVVNHLDGNKTHNAAGNLEYTTYAGNARHARAIGLQAPGRPMEPREPRPWAQGERHPQAKLTFGDVVEIRRLAGLGWPLTDIAPVFGVTRAMVSLIVLRKKWRHVPP